MDITAKWEKALKKTEIIRSRVNPLLTFESTRLPYLFLAESSVNTGDSVVRKGEVMVKKPSIILPENLPLFEGFEFQEELQASDDMVTNFLLVRGIRFPSLKYDNKTSSLDVFEGSLNKAINHFNGKLQKAEDVHTGLVIGPEDCWQFSVIIFICSMVARCADRDIRNMLEDFEKKRRLS